MGPLVYTLDTLPPEALAKISEKLSNEELDNLLDASPQFEIALKNSNVGLFVHTASDGNIRSSLLDGMKSLDGTSLLHKVSSDIENRVEPGRPKHPSLAKMMYIQSYVPPNNLTYLTSEMENLKYLKIQIECLDKINFQQTRLNYPQLQELVIYAPNLGHPYVTNSLNNIPLVTINCLYILQKANYPKLERLSLDLPYSKYNEAALVNAVIGALIKHKSSIKKFLLNFQGNWTIPMVQLPQVQDLQSIAGISLTDVYIRCHNKTGDTYTVLHSLLLTQTELSDICFDTMEYPPLPANLILKNAATLKSIEMDISIEHLGGPINAAIFAPCENLKILSLISNPEVHLVAGENNALPVPEFTELQLLPSSVWSFRICHLNVQSQDVTKLIEKLPQLKLLELQEIGESHGFGVTTEHLDGIMNQRKLQRISVYHGFNKDSILGPQVGQPSPVIGIVSPHLNTCLTFFLKAGEYEIGVGSRNRLIYNGDFINLGMKEYILHYMYGPFQLDPEEKSDEAMDVDEEDGEVEEEQEEDEDDENDNSESEDDDDDDDEDFNDFDY